MHTRPKGNQSPDRRNILTHPGAKGRLSDRELSRLINRAYASEQLPKPVTKGKSSPG